MAGHPYKYLNNPIKFLSDFGDLVLSKNILFYHFLQNVIVNLVNKFCHIGFPSKKKKKENLV